LFACRPQMRRDAAFGPAFSRASTKPVKCSMRKTSLGLYITILPLCIKQRAKA
jgi:hypothetical protein